MVNRGLYVIIILLCIVGSVPGQIHSVIDSLKTASNNSDTSVKIAVYNQLGWEYRKMFPDTSIYFLNKSLSLLDKVEDKHLLPETYNFIGVAYWYGGNYLESFDFHTKAKLLALEIGDSLQYAHALNSLGRLYDATAAYDQAIEYYNQALVIFEKINDNIGLAYIYSSLGMFYKSQKNYPKAEEMTQRSLEIRVKEEHWAGVALSYIELSRIYSVDNKSELAYEMLRKAEQYSKLVNEDLVLKAEINTQLAEIYREKKEFKQALELIQIAKKITENIGNQNLLMKVYGEYGDLYFDLKEYDKAILYHNKVVEATSNSAFMEELKNAYFHLAQDYEQKGNLRLSYENFKKYNEIEKIFLSTERTRLAQQHESRIALEKRAKENELLQVEQKKNKELLDEQKLLNLAIIGIAVLTFFLLIMFMLYSLKRKRDNRLLTIQKDALAEINLQKDTLMNILTHDLKAPFNRILGLCELSKIDKQNADNYNVMIKDATNSGLSLIKNIMEVNKLENSNSLENVTPVDVQELFNSKIANHQEEADKKQIKLNKTIEVEDEFITNQLYLERICDNLISNAIKYSPKESEVQITVYENKDILKFTIKDSGPGFTDKDKANLYKKFTTLSARPTGGEDSNGLGLSLVKTLVDKLGGNIILTSQVGKGSSFEVALPELKV